MTRIFAAVPIIDLFDGEEVIACEAEALMSFLYNYINVMHPGKIFKDKNAQEPESVGSLWHHPVEDIWHVNEYSIESVQVYYPIDNKICSFIPGFLFPKSTIS